MSSERDELSQLIDNLPDYKCKGYLGHGATAYAYEIEHKVLGKQVIKVAKPSVLKEKEELKETFLNEIARLSKIKDPHVIGILNCGTFDLEGLEVPYYIMEYMPADLNKLIKNKIQDLSLEEIVHIIRDIVFALKAMHKEQLVHGDIKEGNIFIDDGLHAKVGDFGCAKLITDISDLESQHGTPQYWSAEQRSYLKKAVQGSDPNNTIIMVPANARKPKWDIYALGCVLSNVIENFCEISSRKLNVEDKRFLDEIIKTMTREDAFGFYDIEKVMDVVNKFVKITGTSSSIGELSNYPRQTIRIPELESVYLSKRVRLIVNHPWFQRLRNIKQLALAYLVYPGAMHTRLEHSLGAYDKAIEYINALLADNYNYFFKTRVSDYEINAFILAALLHDIGHYPYAHSFELFSKEDFSHLEFTLKFIDNSIIDEVPKLAEIDKIYEASFQDIVSKEWDVDMQDIKAILTSEETPKNIDPIFCQIFRSLLDGPIDIDKADYLMRDTLHSGVSYGKFFDLKRFLQGITLDKDTKEVIILEKSKVPAELFLMLRYAMYKDVYRHHTVRAAEAMLNHAVALYFKNKDRIIELESLSPAFKAELYTTLFTKSDDEVFDWLYETGPSETRNILEKIRNRQLFKRLVVYRKNDQNTGQLFEAISNLRWDDKKKKVFEKFNELLVIKLSEFAGTAIEIEDVVVDIPDPRKEHIKNLKVLPEYGAPQPMSTASDIWAEIAKNFQNWIHKIRIFVDEPKRNQIYKKAEKAPDVIDWNEINKLVNEAINDAYGC